MSKTWWYRVLEAIVFGTVAVYLRHPPTSLGFWVLLFGVLAIQFCAEERGKIAARRRKF